MAPIAAALSRDEMRELADYYASRLPGPADGRAAVAPSRIERGRRIARHGIPAQRVPSCADCHGPVPVRRNAAYPLLAGQYSDYLVLQMELFKTRRRGGSAYVHLMEPVVARLAREEMRDVAAYYGSLAPAASSSIP
jgi:cytochrome c553